ncbi:MAG: hypothetical protein IJ405_02890 [Lachnospiraceae bacterium]|nr:hypothetical protein [Lachnospiraceae bacterium]
MVFKCKNCGGNVVYNPERHKMHCPYCDSLESEQKETTGESLTTCINCGGPIEVNEFTSASQCPYCDNYIIFDERVTGEYTPHLIIPFVFSKERVKLLLRDKFKSCVFAPSDFLSEAKLNSMSGMYVPFWMYDYHVRGVFDGQGNKIRRWRSGNTEYTETSVYHIYRDMEVDFDKMPVDSSDAMPDATMDLMEPYDYKALEAFKEEYMSGFFAERYNQDALAGEPRAVDKAKKDAESILKQSISGYVGVHSALNNQVTLQRTDTNYALLPVWIYNYKYKGEDYRFHINGQTGKIIGKVPVAAKKVWGYGATVFASLFTIMMLVRQLLLMF